MKISVTKYLALSLIFILAGFYLWQGGVASAVFRTAVTLIGAGDPLSSGLVGHWTFDGQDVNWATGNVSDLSGQGNTGKQIKMSTTTSPTPGVIGQGLRFDGVDDYVDVGDPSAFTPSTTNGMTISAWVNWRDTTNSRILGKDNTGAREWAFGFTGADAVFFFVFDNSAGTFIQRQSSATYTSRENTWMHVVGVWNGGTTNSALDIYVDAVIVDDTNGGGSTTIVDVDNTATTAKIGFQDIVGSTSYAKGLMDDVRIYNRALSASEVKSLYNQTKKTERNIVNSTDISNNTTTAGLLGWWTFDGKDTIRRPAGNAKGTTFLDKSGNNYHASGTTTEPVQGAVGQGVRIIRTVASDTGGTSGNFINLDAHGAGFNAQLRGAISLWFKAEPWATAQSPLITTSTSGSNDWSGVLLLNKNGGWTGNIQDEVLCYVDGNSYFACITDPTNPAGDTSSGPYADGKWHHYVVVLPNATGRTNRFYLDGVNMTSAMSFYNGTDGSFINLLLCGACNRMSIGAIRRSADSYYADTSIDDVRVYNYEIATSTILQLYNEGKKHVTANSGAATNNILTSGLVGHWTFDGPDVNWATGKINDISGNNNTGKQVNMSTTTSPTPGVFGQGLRFDGTDDVVTIANESNFDFERTSPFSYGLWMKTSNRADTDFVFSKNDPTSAHEGYYFLVCNQGSGCGVSSNNGHVRAIVADVNSNIIRIDSATIGLNDGNWHHYFFTNGGSGGSTDMKLYVDGKNDTVVTSSGPLNATSLNNVNLIIGARASDFASPFNGSLDDVRVYNRALSASEIKQLYDLGR